MITSRLTERLTIKELTTSATTTGLVVDYWKPIKAIAGSITNQRGNLALNGEYLGDTYTDNVSFFCRFHPTVSKLNRKKIRIEWNCKDYEIQNITVVPRNTAIVIDCAGVK